MTEDIGRAASELGPRGRTAIARALREAREYTLAIHAQLDDAQQRFPRIATVNPPCWEVGHVGWFQEFWCRRHRGDDPRSARIASRLADADRWFDSSTVAHDSRWDLPLPGWGELHAYLATTLEDTLESLDRAHEHDDTYRFELALYHEDMHAEAMLMTLHALGLPAPSCVPPRPAPPARPDSGDVEVPGGVFRIGAERDEASRRFVFDNEKFAHDVDIAPFTIAKRCVTQHAFAAFVDDGGYTRADLWSEAGRAWLATAGRDAPAHWRRAVGGDWIETRFGRQAPIEGSRPVEHVNAYEAEAWCRWAGRRLPTEPEWEKAATAGLLPTSWVVWEWTSTPFHPFPGFSPDPYAEYSAPWFGDHRVLRGGSWATQPRLAHPRFRNFYRPQRHDPFAGFRTCAIP